MISNWIGKSISIELLYSSTLHPKDVSEFHKRCDGKSLTLTLYKTNLNKRFGAFNQQTFSSKNEFKGGNGSDFLFSLDKKKFFYNDKDTIYSLYNNEKVFPTFGYPSDLYITKNCFNDFSSYSSFPTSFGSKNKTESGINNKYFAGTREFKLSTIEIYQIKYN